MLHTLFCTVVSESDRVSAVIVENQDGRSAIPDFVIDATGDGYARARSESNHIQTAIFSRRPPASICRVICAESISGS